MNYTDDFEKIWQIYPKRLGGNPKPLAFKQYSARLKQGVPYNDISEGLSRYSNFCDKTGKTKTEWVMRAATFFGVNNEAWTEDWEIPKTEIKETNEQKGVRLNLPARVGESMEQWEKRIQQAREK